MTPRLLAGVGVGLCALIGFVWALPTPPIPAGSVAATNTFAITHVRIFDGEQTLEDATLLVREGRVQAINGPVDERPVVDGRGRTVIPGLIDAHTHSFGTAMSDALNFGVTTELDMFATQSELRDHRAQRSSLERTDEADLFSAGTLATAPGGHGTEYGIPIPTLTTPAQARPWVDDRVREGSDYLKLVYEPGARFPSIDRATMAAVIEAAHAHHLLAVAHISRREAAREAAVDGIDGLMHAFADGPASPEVVAAIQSHGVFVVPTLVVLSAMTNGSKEANALANDRRIAPFLSTAQRKALMGEWGRLDAPLQADFAADAVRALHQAGVELLAGTDAGNRGAAHGASLHHELDLLVRCGLTPREALIAATAAPARRFGLSDRGRLAPGLRADLVLVEGNPMVDIHATRAIVAIWKNGYEVTRHGAP